MEFDGFFMLPLRPLGGSLRITKFHEAFHCLMIGSVLIAAQEQKKKIDFCCFVNCRKRRWNSFLYLAYRVTFHAWLQ
jgi:hypothetical protein